MVVFHSGVMTLILLFGLLATCMASRVRLVSNDNGSLSIMTVNGTVMVDQLDLKEAFANLQTMNANLSLELSRLQSKDEQATQQPVINVLSSALSASIEANFRLNATVQRLEEATTVLNQYLPGRYFSGPQRVLSETADGARSVYATDLDNDGDMDVLAIETTR
jgi:hypothetical protein